MASTRAPSRTTAPSRTPPRPRAAGDAVRPVRTVSKEADRPLYVQLYELLRDDVQRGALKPGDPIAAESELIRQYGVSRITVRAALDLLVQDGYIDRHRGRGSFVRATAPQARACLSSFTDQMLRLGRRPTTEVLSVRVAPAADFDAVQLPFGADDEVVLIERLRSVDGAKVALVRSYIPHRLAPGLSASDFSPEGPEQSLLHVLEHRFGIVLDKGEEAVVPRKIVGSDAECLGLEDGDAVALKICAVRDITGAPVLYEEASWCAPQTQLVQRVYASCA